MFSEVSDSYVLWTLGEPVVTRARGLDYCSVAQGRASPLGEEGSVKRYRTVQVQADLSCTSLSMEACRPSKTCTTCWNLCVVNYVGYRVQGFVL